MAATPERRPTGPRSSDLHPGAHVFDAEVFREVVQGVSSYTRVDQEIALIQQESPSRKK